MRPSLVLLAVTALAPAQGIPWWTGTWEEALAEARRRNVPLLVAFIQDGEEANERIVSGLFQSGSFQDLTRRTVPVIASIAIHRQDTVSTGGRTRKVCSRFGRVPCQVHKDQELAARIALWGPETPVKTPSHVVALPDGKPFDRLIDVHPESAYDDLVTKAQRKLGRGLSGKEFDQASTWLTTAEKRLKAGEVEALLSEKEAIDRLVAGTPMAAEMKEVEQRVEHHGQALVSRANGLVEAKKEGEALRAIVGAWKVYQGTEAGRVLRSLENRLRRTAEGREVLRELAKEKRARPRFDEGRTAVEERRWVDAYLAFRRAYETAPETGLGKEALEALEGLVQDPDIGPLIAPRRERDATAALERARKLKVRSAKRSRESLELIVRLYAGTAAAKEAATLLEK